MSSFDKILVLMGPAFRTREFSAALGKSAGYARLVLHRLKKRGELENLKRGWWAQPNALPEEVAAIISYPCYVSFQSALYGHGLTTQLPLKVQIVVSRKARKYAVFSTRVQEYRVPKQAFNGYDVRKGLPLATPEKAFADCLRLPRSCPAIILVEALPKLGEEKIRGYCSKRMLERLEKVRKQC